MLQVAASLLVFGRPCSLAYVRGLGLMASGMGLYQFDRSRQRQSAPVLGSPAEGQPYHLLGRWRTHIVEILGTSDNSAAVGK